MPLLLRLRSAVGEARAAKASAGQEISQLKKTKALLEEDLSFLTQFLKDFPRLARDLYSGLTERRSPHAARWSRRASTRSRSPCS